MSGRLFRINSGIVVATGAVVSAIGLAGCAVFSITPSGTVGLHPGFTAIAAIGIAIVIGSSFVEARMTARKSRDPDDLP